MILLLFISTNINQPKETEDKLERSIFNTECQPGVITVSWGNIVRRRETIFFTCTDTRVRFYSFFLVNLLTDTIDVMVTKRSMILGNTPLYYSTLPLTDGRNKTSLFFSMITLQTGDRCSSPQPSSCSTPTRLTLYEGGKPAGRVWSSLGPTLVL